MNEPIAGDLFGKYGLERRLGSGGMGEVWLARPLEPSGAAEVVIKLLHHHLAEDERALRRFLDETRLARLLHHPNVIELFEVGQERGIHFMAMEFVDGLQLRQCLSAHGGPLALPLAAAICAEACAGLEYAHGLADRDGKPLRLVHRDVAPDNVMVDRQGRVKLVDFGIARTVNTDLTTKAGDRRGKVRYVPPEYLKGEEATARSDVYSMGATLFEVCTGKRPFGELKNLLEIAAAIVNKGLPGAGTLNPGIPPELSTIIATATQRDPARRFSTAGAMEGALRRFLAKHPAPTPQMIGREIALWKPRLGDPGATADRNPPARPTPTPSPAPAAAAKPKRSTPAVTPAVPTKAPARPLPAPAAKAPPTPHPAPTAQSAVAAFSLGDPTLVTALPSMDLTPAPSPGPAGSMDVTAVSSIGPLIEAGGTRSTLPEPPAVQVPATPEAATARRGSWPALESAPRFSPPVPELPSDEEFPLVIDLDEAAVVPPGGPQAMREMPAVVAVQPALASVVIDGSLLGPSASAIKAASRPRAGPPKATPPAQRPSKPAAEDPSSTIIVSEDLGAEVIVIPPPPKPKGRR